MSTTRVVDADVVHAAAAALRDTGGALDEVASDVEGTGRTATAAAGQFAGELQEGAATLSLSWGAAVAQVGQSATVVAGAADQAVAVAQELDRRSAAGIAQSGAGGQQ